MSEKGKRNGEGEGVRFQLKQKESHHVGQGENG